MYFMLLSLLILGYVSAQPCNNTCILFTQYCNSTHCVDKSLNGHACLTSLECLSGLCVDFQCTLPVAPVSSFNYWTWILTGTLLIAFAVAVLIVLIRKHTVTTSSAAPVTKTPSRRGRGRRPSVQLTLPPIPPFMNSPAKSAHEPELVSSDAKSSDVGSYDMKSSDAGSSDTKSADMKSVDMKSVDTKSADTRSFDAKSSNTRSADASAISISIMDRPRAPLPPVVGLKRISFGSLPQPSIRISTVPQNVDRAVIRMPTYQRV